GERVVQRAIGPDERAERRLPNGRDFPGHLLRSHQQEALQLSGEGVIAPILVKRGRAYGEEFTRGEKFHESLVQLAYHRRGRLDLSEDTLGVRPLVCLGERAAIRLREACFKGL